MQSVTVVGAGAIGSVIASRLQRSGVDVKLLATRRSAESIWRCGMRVNEDGRQYTTRPFVTDNAEELGVQDVVLLCMKGHSATAGANSFAPLVGPKTIIVSAQNGIPWWYFHGFECALQGQRLNCVDPAGELVRIFPPQQVVGCVIHMASRIDEEGVVHPGAKKQFIVGEPFRDGSHNKLDIVAELLSGAGFGIEKSRQIQQSVWLKLWGNLPLNPLSALTGATCDRLLDDALTRGLVLGMMEETRCLGCQLGVDPGMTAEQRLNEIRALGAIKSSMLQDFEAGRMPEVDPIIGAAAEIGRLLSQPTPSIDAVLGIVRQLVVTRSSQLSP